MRRLNVAVLSLLGILTLGILAGCNSSASLKQTVPYKVGEWLPSDQKFFDEWLGHVIDKAETSKAPLLPVMQEFKDIIERDPHLFMLFNQMFTQIPNQTLFSKDPTGKPQVKNYRQMLAVMNQILKTAPEFNKSGLVGFPINAILDWPMGTPAGTEAFLNEKVNGQLKKILDYWATFLESKKSCYVLNDDPENGWFGREAKAAMPTFVEDFICDPKAPHYGFKSWDDFFTRQFRKGRRPVASPDDDSIIVNSCESAPYQIIKDVKMKERFWIKGQPYSLQHMLAMDPFAKKFDGGTVYQAFLSALSYHRWHSPVAGKIVKTRLIDGSYYAEDLTEGFDPAVSNNSQSYITNVAARALIFIEADNPDIGLMCLVFIGMGEVSSCDITVKKGEKIKKGEQLGMFHFGGSTHCMIFRPEVKLKWDMHGQTPGLESSNILLKKRIATVIKK